MEKSSGLGMRTFDQALFELHQAGKITFDEAIKNADSANNLRLRIKLESQRPQPKTVNEGLLQIEEDRRR